MATAAMIGLGGAAFLEKTSDNFQFLAQLGKTLGPNRAQPSAAQLKNITEALSSTYASLPKNAMGSLEVATARYVVHRFFFEHHAWQVKGLAPTGQSWSTSAGDLGGLGDHLPEEVLALFDKRLGQNGLDLPATAAIIATIQNLVHGEVMWRVNATYTMLERDAGRDLVADDAIDLLDVYMAAHIQGLNISQTSWPSVRQWMSRVQRVPYWQLVQRLVRDTWQELLPGRGPALFSEVARVAEAVTERFGPGTAQVQCEDVTAGLVKLDRLGIGRVSMRDFYNSKVNGKMHQFTESLEYLRIAGVIDDSMPSDPHLIIPNYLQIKSNCHNVTSVYDTCCIDKCEALLSHIEENIRAPHATVPEIVSVVSALPSASVPAPRTLSESLLSKLADVAAHHEGQIALHGRLFSQFLHFAYPRECSYPHLAGTTEFPTKQEWFDRTGESHLFKDDEMRKYIERSEAEAQRGSGDGPHEGCSEDLCTAMWVVEEELVDVRHGKASASSLASLRSVVVPTMRACAFVVAAVSFAMVLLEGAKKGGPQVFAKKDNDVFV